MSDTDPYYFDDEPTTNRPQLLTEQLVIDNFGSLLDFDDLEPGSPEAEQLEMEEN